MFGGDSTDVAVGTVNVRTRVGVAKGVWVFVKVSADVGVVVSANRAVDIGSSVGATEVERGFVAVSVDVVIGVLTRVAVSLNRPVDVRVREGVVKRERVGV